MIRRVDYAAADYVSANCRAHSRSGDRTLYTCSSGLLVASRAAVSPRCQLRDRASLQGTPVDPTDFVYQLGAATPLLDVKADLPMARVAPFLTRLPERDVTAIRVLALRWHRVETRTLGALDQIDTCELSVILDPSATPIAAFATWGDLVAAADAHAPAPLRIAVTRAADRARAADVTRGRAGAARARSR